MRPDHKYQESRQVVYYRYRSTEVLEERVTYVFKVEE
jgi:hypothetical protein